MMKPYAYVLKCSRVLVLMSRSKIGDLRTFNGQHDFFSSGGDGESLSLTIR